jgi:hypothetical protein
MTSNTRRWKPRADTDFTARRATVRWVATERCGVNPAPGGLALVEDLLNTHAKERHGDVLGDVAQANRWATSAVRAWSTQRGDDDHALSQFSDHDAGGLRDLRDALGMVTWQPLGFGWQWIASAVWS